jgi:hypothetical protein
MWRELIGQLTHFMPNERGTAEGLVEALSEAPLKYHVGEAGESAEGPVSVDEVVRRVLDGTESLELWWSGAESWTSWEEVAEVRLRVERERAKTPPPRPGSVRTR